ncbi:MAG: response regulator [Acidobacteria bacterium]|nr:response regulator [Acidobacteriota bacterium]
MSYNQFSIVVVEDSAADAEMVRIALEEVGITNGLTCFQSGPRALEYLEAGTASCDLLLLDLNLPCLSGFEVLERIRNTQRWRGLPIIMMSGSNSEQDIERSYALGANGYISKPVHLPDILATGQRIADYLVNGIPPVETAGSNAGRP